VYFSKHFKKSPQKEAIILFECFDVDSISIAKKQGIFVAFAEIQSIQRKFQNGIPCLTSSVLA
jgi:hypothetical protein